MNTEQLVSIARQIMLVLGGSLVTRGYLDSGTLEAIVGAILTLAASGWAIYSRRTVGLARAAADQPGVIVSSRDPKFVQAAAHPDVVLRMP